METKLVLFALVSTFSLLPSALHAQGALTPSGAPAPTMKSLYLISGTQTIGPIVTATGTTSNPWANFSY